MFHSFFNSLARSRYLSFFSYSFRFIMWSAVTAKTTILHILFFLLIIIRPGFLADIRWSVCMLKSHRSLCVLFSGTGAGLGRYHFLVWSNLNFLQISQWITLSTQSCLVLYSFCANLLHSLLMLLMVSSLLPHSLYLLFCWVLSMLALIWLVLMALFYTAIRSDFVSLLNFLFLGHVQVLLCKMFISRLKRPQRCFSSHFCFLIIVIIISIIIKTSLVTLVRLYTEYIFSDTCMWVCIR